MSQQPQDDKGLARQALGSAVASYGISVLGDQQALREALTRLLPNSPRERSLLSAAAGADVAGRLRRHIQEGYEDVARAVQNVARELAERTAIEQTACLWATAEFARVLGYPDSSAATLAYATVQLDDEQLPPDEPVPQQWAPPQPGVGGYQEQAAYGVAGAGIAPPTVPPGVQPAVQPPAMQPGVQPPGAQPGAQSPVVQPPGVQPPGAQPVGQPFGFQQPGVQPGGQPLAYQPPGAQQPGMQPPGIQPGVEPPGFQQPGVQPPAFQQPGVQPPAFQQPGVQPPVFQQPGVQQPGMQQPGFQQPGIQQPAAQQGGWWQVPPGQVPPGPGGQMPGYGPPRRSGTRGRVILIVGVAVVVVLGGYVGAAAATHLFPFHHAAAAPPPRPIVRVTHKPTPTPTPTPTSTVTALPPGKDTLTSLLPGVLDDPASQCSPILPPYHWAMSGVVQALQCNQVPGLHDGTVFAFQLDSASNYLSAWGNYNQWWGFNGSAAGTACPPSGTAGEGTVSWSGHFFPQHDGQVLECEEVSGNQPAYTWTIPSQYAFIAAQGAPGSTFASLQSWWTADAGPNTAPSPATP